jgi:Bacterial archaeo-eukaryotic release factor family 7
MHLTNAEQLNFLLQTRERFCVSIFLPTHRAGAEIRQDPIRLKNLIKEAESRLIALGQKATKARELLAPARQLTERGTFWRYQQDGLAVFLAPGLFQYLRVPLALQEFVSVSESFEVSPLLPLFTAGGHFYVLAISRNRVRFFYGTPEVLQELEIPEIPHSVDEALKYDVRESQLQLHSAAGANAVGKEGAVFTGQGVGVDDEEGRTREFLLMVEKGVRYRLRKEHAPLVLAGVTELLAGYREANKYPALLEGDVTGNPDLLKPEELHRAAWEVVAPHFEGDRHRALAAYQELTGSGRVAQGLEGTLVSAYEGRVDTAFLPAGAHEWGKFEPDENKVEVHSGQRPGDEDLVNAVAVQTVLHRGTVYVMPAEQLPNGSGPAAILRY